jgi:preprotein translocase subunit SecF
VTDTNGTNHSSEDGKHHNAFVRLYRGETHYDFVGRRRWFYLLSALIIVAGFISFATKGFELNLGIDFKGGTQWTVQAHGATVTQATNAIQSASGVTPSSVQTLGVGADQQLKVEADLNQDTAAQRQKVTNEITEALARLTHSPPGQVSVTFVGATWGSTVTNKALEAMLVFFLLVTIYIAIRFQWRMAFAALLKVIFHDLLITLAIFSLTNFQVTPDAVIAVLTILGYSLYDTVVVFDKINENVKALKSSRLTYLEIVNLSLNQVLARSINTSLVAVMPVLSVLVVGGQLLGASTLEQFGFPLLIGLVAGAYSSIFIAAPLRSDNESRDAKILASRGTGVEVLTPRAAAAMLAGAAPVTPSTRSSGRSTQGRSSGTLSPGAARSAKAPAKKRPAGSVATVDGDGPDDDDDDVVSSGAPAKAGAAKGSTTARPAASAARRPPPRPRKGGGKGKGKKRR